MSSELVPVPNLRAAASLPASEADRLREAGFRSLPEDHALRNLARWSRRTWRPAVRVHALRALVRSPASLSSLSARAQDMLFAVFRTVNASNRAVASKIFGVLLLTEDPWLIDAGGDGVDGDAERAAKAFLSLYDARHEFLGDAQAASGAFVDPELLHRENDALRRHLHQMQTVPVAKARRIGSDSGQRLPLPPPPGPPPGRGEGRGEPRSLSPMDRFMPFLSDTSSGDERSGLEARVAELTAEVVQLREQLRESERKISTLTSSYDVLVRLVLDNMPAGANVPPGILSKLSATGSAVSLPRTTEPEIPATRSPQEAVGEANVVGNGGKDESPTGTSETVKRASPPKPIDISAAKPPSGLREHEHEIPNMLSPDRTPRKSGALRASFPLTASATAAVSALPPLFAPAAVPAAAPATVPVSAPSTTGTDKPKPLDACDLESFRSMVQASPWSFLAANAKGEEVAAVGPPVAKDPPELLKVHRTPVRVFRDGRWLENQ